MRSFFIIFVLLCLPANTLGQSAISTFGSTDASQCFSNARETFSNDIAPCRRAIEKVGALSKKDYLATLVNRGIIYNRRNELTLAIRDFNEALTFDPDLAEAYLNRGNSYFLAERFEEALSDYQSAIDNNVRNLAAAFYNKGLAQLALKDPAGAKGSFERALSEKADFKPALEKLNELIEN